MKYFYIYETAAELRTRAAEGDHVVDVFVSNDDPADRDVWTDTDQERIGKYIRAINPDARIEYTVL